MIEEGHAVIRACIRRGPTRSLSTSGRDPGRPLRGRLLRSDRLAPDPRSLRSSVLGHAHSLWSHSIGQSPSGRSRVPVPALTALDAVAADLDDYHLMHAARGTMLRRLGQRGPSEGRLRTRSPPRSDGNKPAVSRAPDRRVGRERRAQPAPARRTDRTTKRNRCALPRDQAIGGAGRRATPVDQAASGQIGNSTRVRISSGGTVWGSLR